MKMSEMNDVDILMKMFIMVHGEEPNNFHYETFFDDHGNAAGIEVSGGEYVCWSKSKLDILFDYIVLLES